MPSPGVAAELRGHVVLVDFRPLTCISWPRSEPYLSLAIFTWSWGLAVRARSCDSGCSSTDSRRARRTGRR